MIKNEELREHFVKSQTDIYKSIVDRAITGERLTDNEILFIMSYSSMIQNQLNTPNFIKFIEYAKQVVNAFDTEVK